MFLYILAAVIGYLFCEVMHKPKKSLDTDLYKWLKAGKQVVICVGTDATIMKMVGTKLQLRKATMELFLEDEHADLLDNLRSVESPADSESGPQNS